MPTGQQYATNVPQTTLSAGIGAGTTNFNVTSLSSWPTPPFTAVIDLGLSTQEPIDVLTVSGNTIASCTRSIDGTAAFSHGSGATFTHADIGRDFREARAHIDASSSNDSTGHVVHGLTSGSAVVGTLDSQTLQSKTLSAPAIVTATFSGLTTMGSSPWQGTGSLLESNVGASGMTGTTAQSRIVGAGSTGVAPTTGSFATGDIYLDLTNNTYWVCTSGGTPGTWRPVNGLYNIKPSNGQLANISVPSWADGVRLNWNCRSGGAGTGNESLFIQFNGDGGTNYDYQYAIAQGGTASGSGPTSQNSIQIGFIPQSGSTGNMYGTGVTTITGILQGAYPSLSGTAHCPTTSVSANAGTFGGVWKSSAVVTSLKLNCTGNSFNAGSSVGIEFLE